MLYYVNDENLYNANKRIIKKKKIKIEIIQQKTNLKEKGLKAISQSE